MRARSTSALVLVLALTACISTGGGETKLAPAGERTDSIVIGAFNFSESRLLAEIYHRSLEDAGFPADVMSEVASREIMEPALEQGEVDVVLEYVGTALNFLTSTSGIPVSSGAIYPRLKREFGDRGITVLAHAPGQNRNEIVVLSRLAERLGLEQISDLEDVANELTFGGPPECPARPLCLQGLEETYGLTFKNFLALDSGGPRTVAALLSEEVDVALLFTTSPALQDPILRVLRDDRHLQPPENIVPVLRDDVAARYGVRLTDTIDRVTNKLTDEALRSLNDRLTGDASVRDVAEEWLTEEGLI